MSAYSTLDITRGKAQEVLMQHIASGLSDQQLAEFLDRVLEPRLYNVRIVPDGTRNDDEVL